MAYLLFFGLCIVLVIGGIGWTLDAIGRTQEKYSVEKGPKTDYHLIRSLEREIYGEVYTELPEGQTPREPEFYKLGTSEDLYELRARNAREQIRALAVPPPRFGSPSVYDAQSARKKLLEQALPHRDDQPDVPF